MRKSFSCLIIMSMFFVFLHEAGAQEQWMAQNSGVTANLYRVQFLDSLQGYAVGDGGLVLKTTDGGLNWNSVPLPSINPVRDLAFVTAELGWVVTGDENNYLSSGSVWQTTNGGAAWIEQPLGNSRARFGLSFVSSTEGWTCGAVNGNWDIQATTNGGTSWMQQSGSGYGWLYDIDFISPTLGWAIGVVYYPTLSGMVITTGNGGAAWSQLNTGTVSPLNGMQFLDSDHGFAVGERGTVLVTTNGGLNWTNMQTGANSDLNDLSFVSPELGWVCGMNGTIFKTSNGGANWESQPSGIVSELNGIFFVDSTTGWAVGEGGTILTTSVITSVENPSLDLAPLTFDLLPCFPNPFNSTTVISFDLPASGDVKLAVYDITGREVQVLGTGHWALGKHSVVWNADGCVSGVYFIRLMADGRWLMARKVVLMK